MTTYYVSDGHANSDESYATVEEARAEAQSWIDDAPSLFPAEDQQGPYTVDVVRLDGDGWTETVETFTITIAPSEPPCPDLDDHAWTDHGGPWGHGAGVRYEERCSVCGLIRETDTARLNLEDGTTYRHISYRDDSQSV